MLLGSGVLVLGKVFGPCLSGSFFDLEKQHFSKDFQAIKEGKELAVYDRFGEKILVTDREYFLKNFRITENKREANVYNKVGEKILVISKG